MSSYVDLFVLLPIRDKAQVYSQITVMVFYYILFLLFLSCVADMEPLCLLSLLLRLPSTVEQLYGGKLSHITHTHTHTHTDTNIYTSFQLSVHSRAAGQNLLCHLCVRVYVCFCVYVLRVCVCVRERERERAVSPETHLSN